MYINNIYKKKIFLLEVIYYYNIIIIIKFENLKIIIIK